MTNETFCRNRYIYLGLSTFGHILKGSMEIFQDGAFPYGKCSKISNTLKLRTPKIIAENNF